MKAVLVVLTMLISSFSIAQSGLSEDNAKMMVDVFFQGFHKGDTTLMRSVMVNNMRMQSVYTSKDDGNKITYMTGKDFFKMISSRPEGTVWEEKLKGYSVEIDGNLATVWTPYSFLVNGEISHCGANAFTLVNTNDGWKIYSVLDSRRVGKCEE